jgi:predicted transcriptional regulator
LSFISSFVEHTKLYESPNSFWLWSAYAAIAGVLRDNVWLKDGDGRLYPNVYILFLAGSAQKKARPVNMCEQLVHEVSNTNVISGRSSIQAIMMEIGRTETNKTTGKLTKSGAAIFFAPELAAGLVGDDQAIQILTDIYDYKPIPHTTNLIGRGKIKLDRIVFSMLVASNEELLKDFLNSRAIYGGLLGRIFLITPNEWRPGNAFPKGDPVSFGKIKEDLILIANLHGEITFTPDSYQYYDKWYNQVREQSRNVPDRAGIMGRLGTNVKKLAILLAANDLTVEVTQQHVDSAITQCLALVPNYRFFSMSAGKSTIAEAGVIILELLSREKELDHKKLLREHWMDADPETFDTALSSFELSGLIQTTLNGSNSRVFQLTSKGKEILGK